MLTQGNTPFEIAERKRREANFMLEAAIGTQKLVDQIRECDVQINYFLGLTAIGEADEDERALAREARKDKKAYEAALDVIVRLTHELARIEA
jgi:hypothetical protein